MKTRKFSIFWGTNQGRKIWREKNSINIYFFILRNVCLCKKSYKNMNYIKLKWLGHNNTSITLQELAKELREYYKNNSASFS